MDLITSTHLQEAATYGQNYAAQVAASAVTAIEELITEIEALQSTIETLTSESEELDTRAALLEYMLIQNEVSAPIEVSGEEESTIIVDENGYALIANWAYQET